MNRPLRIGLATPSNGFAGGLERYASMVARGLRARGHFVRHLYTAVGGRDPDSFARSFDDVASANVDAAQDLDVVFLQRAARVDDLAPFGKTPLLIASHDHAHTCVRSYRYLPLTTSPCHRPPGVMCWLNGCIVNKSRTPGRRAGIELRDPFALRRAVRSLAQRAPLVACSRYVADHLVRAGVPAPRVHVAHPVPPPDPTPVVPRPSEHRLVVAGQLLRGKGVDIAIRALQHLAGHVTLSVVGDGPSRAQLQALAERVAPRRVTFTGYAPPEGVAAHYDAARVVLVPSRWPEPFGMVGIEAMRRARPVVAADHGGIPEWAPRSAGGRLFVPGSAVDLAAATRQLLKDESAGTSALEYTQAHHDHDSLLDALERLLGAQVAPQRSRA